MINGIVASQSRAESARFWRLLITATNGAAFVEVREIRMRVSPGGMEPLSGGTEYFTSPNSQLAGFYAMDGGYYGETPWRSAAVMPAWIGRTYVSTQTQTALLGHFDITAASDATAAPKDFKIQYSHDEAAWVTVLEETNQTGWASGETRGFSF